MAGKIKSVTNPRLSLNMFSPQDIQRLHTATLDVIEHTGVRSPSKRALEIWKAHGAHVDHATSIVKAPGELVEQALKQAPPFYALAARDQTQDLPLDGNHVWLGTDGCGVEIIDLETGQRRRSRLQDVEEISRLADHLEEIAFHWVPLSAQDKPAHTRGLHELKALRDNSTKHVQTELVFYQKATTCYRATILRRRTSS